ncbi:hypothetical protein E3U55_08215 [Filobacillus milosensis]|uniref:Uncharacterized protein n=1 Tax=Filobacillus milosensis TaxID=94137 RepID=A0A4Y8INJ1_9BACI|nr:hypothetical protein [Filobacillus milosensis]TFB21799.1 hypothetical protein E3U55_08215 [Filobacillus milosensis]
MQQSNLTTVCFSMFGSAFVSYLLNIGYTVTIFGAEIGLAVAFMFLTLTSILLVKGYYKLVSKFSNDVKKQLEQ